MKMTKPEALKRAKQVMALLGPKWKIRVWENDGWHWEVYSVDRYLSVRESVPGGFWCLFSTTHPGCGDCRWYAPEDKCYPTPREAVLAQIRLVREVISKDISLFMKILDAVDNLESDNPPKDSNLRRRIARILDSYGESFLSDDGVDQDVVDTVAGEILKTIKAKG